VTQRERARKLEADHKQSHPCREVREDASARSSVPEAGADFYYHRRFRAGQCQSPIPSAPQKTGGEERGRGGDDAPQEATVTHHPSSPNVRLGQERMLEPSRLADCVNGATLPRPRGWRGRMARNAGRRGNVIHMQHRLLAARIRRRGLARAGWAQGWGETTSDGWGKAFLARRAHHGVIHASRAFEH